MYWSRVVYACNPSTREAGGSPLWGKLGLHKSVSKEKTKHTNFRRMAGHSLKRGRGLCFLPPSLCSLCAHVSEILLPCFSHKLNTLFKTTLKARLSTQVSSLCSQTQHWYPSHLHFIPNAHITAIRYFYLYFANHHLQSQHLAWQMFVRPGACLSS